MGLYTELGETLLKSWYKELSRALAKYGKKTLGGLRPKKTLSVSDGTSHGQHWLKPEGIELGDQYMASEIDPYAIKFSELNFPKMQSLGDMTKVSVPDLPYTPEVVVGGTPCNNFSKANRVNRDGMFDYTANRPILSMDQYLDAKANGHDMTPSSLFYEFKRLVDEAELAGGKTPDFMLENVASMSPFWRDKISDIMGVPAYRIGGKGPQNRPRYIWTNATSPSEHLAIQQAQPQRLWNPRERIRELSKKQDYKRAIDEDELSYSLFGDEAGPKLYTGTSANGILKSRTRDGHLPTITGSGPVKIFDTGNWYDLTLEDLLELGNWGDDIVTDGIPLTKLKKMLGLGWDDSVRPYFLNLYK